MSAARGSGEGGGPGAGMLPYLLLCVSAVAWGGNITVGRFVHGYMPPATLNLARWTVAWLVLAPVAGPELLRQRAVLLRHWRYLCVMALAGMVVFHTCVYRALQQTEALNAALILSLTPVTIVLLSRLLLGERVRRHQAAGVVVSLAGAAVLITRGDPLALRGIALNPGDLWMLAAVPSWALYSVLLRRRPVELEPRAFLAGTVTLAVLMMVPVAGLELAGGARPVFGMASVLSVLYVGVVASVLAFTCWNRGVALIGANRAGQFMHLIPLAAAVLAIVFLGEVPHRYHVAGAVLIFGGIWLMNGAPLPRAARARAAVTGDSR